MDLSSACKHNGETECSVCRSNRLRYNGIPPLDAATKVVLSLGAFPGQWQSLPIIELPPVVQHPLFPSSAAERKKVPLASGVLDYFTSALIEVAKVSFAGNEQHNPGEPLHWARGKSTDQDDTIIRHFMERGKFDTDGQRHSAKLVWRALALLQLELEAEGAPIARGARFPEETK